MDITLERILSLIPKNENGKFKHGSKAEFARNIGYDSGDVVSMWQSGSSVSYKKKLHEISLKYGVSVEWLKGETDEKTPPTTSVDGVGELSDTEKHLIELFRQLPKDSRESVPALLEASLKAQGLL